MNADFKSEVARLANKGLDAAQIAERLAGEYSNAFLEQEVGRALGELQAEVAAAGPAEPKHEPLIHSCADCNRDFATKEEYVKHRCTTDRKHRTLWYVGIRSSKDGTAATIKQARRVMRSLGVHDKIESADDENAGYFNVPLPRWMSKRLVDNGCLEEEIKLGRGEYWKIEAEMP